MSNIDTIRVGGIDYSIEDANSATDSNIAYIEQTPTATRNYTKGQYIYIRSADKLYKVTATTISSGATLSTSTNIAETTVGAELTSLNSDLATKSDTITSNLKIYQSSNVVTISGYLSKADYSTTATIIGTIPSGYKKPPHDLRTVCTLADAAYKVGDTAELFISANNGQLDIASASSLSQKVAYFCVTYVAS